MVPVNFHRMVLSLHYCREPKNTYQISPEGCVMDRGVYQRHPALSLHLEKYQWLNWGDLARWICLGILYSPLSATEAKVVLVMICYCNSLLQYIDNEHRQIKATVITDWILDSRPCWWGRAVWLTSSGGPEVVVFTSAVWGCWNLTPCVLLSLTRQTSSLTSGWKAHFAHPVTWAAPACTSGQVYQLMLRSLCISEIVNCPAHKGKFFWQLWCACASVLSVWGKMYTWVCVHVPMLSYSVK